MRTTTPASKVQGCCLAMILGGTHTGQSKPERFARWAKRAQEAVAELR